jgi:hypothetical protein
VDGTIQLVLATFAAAVGRFFFRLLIEVDVQTAVIGLLETNIRMLPAFLGGAFFVLGLRPLRRLEIAPEHEGHRPAPRARRSGPAHRTSVDAQGGGSMTYRNVVSAVVRALAAETINSAGGCDFEPKVQCAKQKGEIVGKEAAFLTDCWVFGRLHKGLEASSYPCGLQRKFGCSHSCREPNQT